MTTQDNSTNPLAQPSGTLVERARLFSDRIRARAAAELSSQEAGIRAFDPVVISGVIEDMKTEGADCGLNHARLHSHASGLLIGILSYLNMREGDWIRVFWGDDSTPVATGGIGEEHLDDDIFSMYVPVNRVPDGLHSLYYIVTRAGSGNQDESLPINIFTRTVFPGGTDPEPDKPGHQNLRPPIVDLPASGIIDGDAAKQGVNVTIERYPNMRVYDTVRLSWGGEFVEHEVTQAEVDAGSLDILVTEQTILAAGDSDDLVVIYWIWDEVHNQASAWSERTNVIVEVGEGLLQGPYIQNPDPDTPAPDLIDLDVLGDADLEVFVSLVNGTGVAAGDYVELTWIGTTSQGQVISPELAPLRVSRVPSVLVFDIPNAALLPLAQGRGVVSYVVTRDGSEIAASKRAFATFQGAEQRLPKPVVSDMVNGTLDPTLDSVTVTVDGDALGGGDTLDIIWLGTRSNGTPLLEEFRRNISGGNAGKPVTVTIPGERLIAPLNGGSVSVYYRLIKYGSTVPLESDRELLMVGEAQFELPAPFTRPPSDSGALDPDDIVDQLEIVILPYPGMQADQVLHLSWRASGGGQHSDFLPISQPIEGQTVVFYMDRALVEEFLGEDIEVAYRVEHPGEPTRLSAPAKFTVGAKAAPLPDPEVVEAKGNVLNPADARGGATVRIPIEANLQHGDDVEVSWQGDKPGGSTTVSEQVFPGDVGDPFDLIVDYQYVIANADGNVVVSYKVFRQDGGVPESNAITLRVQSVLLPLPEFVEAEGDELNPDDVLKGATVRIDASAQFQVDDVVSVLVMSSVSGGSTTIEHRIPPGGAGQPVSVLVPYAVINASTGTRIDLAYEIQRAAGGPIEPSDKVSYLVNREIGSGPLLVMGARFNISTYRASGAPRMISAVHATTLAPLLAEWRYEDSAQWTARTHWFDNKPWLKLYVRSETETWMLQPANVIGNGVDTTATGMAAFAAMRDGVTVGGEIEVDMVAWGHNTYGGDLDSLINIKNVEEISATSNAYAARLRDGNVVCWGVGGGGGNGPDLNGNFVQVRSNARAFAAIRSDGSLYAWGAKTHGVPVTGPALDHRDYVEVYGAALAFAARRATGHVVVWGDPTNGGLMEPGQEVHDDIVQVCGNYGAFAALRSNATGRHVIAWGNSSYGGSVHSSILPYNNVKALGAATAQAFSILLDTGEVRAWGAGTHGGTVPDSIEALKTVVEVSSTWHAFCARLSTGRVVGWPLNNDNGGKIPKNILDLSDIVQVVGSAWSFAALRRNGLVVAWGSAVTGGDLSEVGPQLYDIQAIYANSHGFTALRRDGAVITWGVKGGGGDSSDEQHRLHGRVTHGRIVPAGANGVEASEVVEGLTRN